MAAKQKTVSIDTWRGENAMAAALLLAGEQEAASRNNPAGKTPPGGISPRLRDVQDRAPLKCRLLVVADAGVREQISVALADLNHQMFEAQSTEIALSLLAAQVVDLIVVALKVPAIGGIAFCETLRKLDATRLIPVFIQAAADEQHLEIRAINAGADEFLPWPLTPTALRARVHATLRHRAMMEMLDDSEAVLFSLAKTVEDRDPDLSQHCYRLALMAAGMGIALGLSAANIRTLHRGGFLHDIGKITIPDHVLFKAGPLTADEWAIMKSHTVRGERICACSRSLAPVLPIIRSHHERFDGSGYPDGLKGEQIPLLARILQIADIYDALTTERPYKRAYTPEEALIIMRNETRKGWRDPLLVETFAELLPAFRHPAVLDSANLSLRALAVSLEDYRRESLLVPASTVS